MKIYQAYSQISLSIILPTGGKKYVIFNARSNGKSTYRATSEMLANALEAHRDFGKSFFLLKDDGEWDSKAPTPEKVDVEADKELKKSAVKESNIVEVVVSCWDDAKAYLMENFAVTPGKVNLPQKINKVAAENNIRFIFAK